LWDFYEQYYLLAELPNVFCASYEKLVKEKHMYIDYLAEFLGVPCSNSLKEDVVHKTGKCWMKEHDHLFDQTGFNKLVDEYFKTRPETEYFKFNCTSLISPDKASQNIPTSPSLLKYLEDSWTAKFEKYGIPDYKALQERMTKVVEDKYKIL